MLPLGIGFPELNTSISILHANYVWSSTELFFFFEKEVFYKIAGEGSALSLANCCYFMLFIFLIK